MLCVLIRIASSSLMSTLNIQLLCRKSIGFPELAIFASWSGAMINLQWRELPMSRTNFLGPKDVRAIEVRLYILKGGTLENAKTHKHTHTHKWWEDDIKERTGPRVATSWGWIDIISTLCARWEFLPNSLFQIGKHVISPIFNIPSILEFGVQYILSQASASERVKKWLINTHTHTHTHKWWADNIKKRTGPRFASWQRLEIESTLFQPCVPAGNFCQILVSDWKACN